MTTFMDKNNQFSCDVDVAHGKSSASLEKSSLRKEDFMYSEKVKVYFVRGTLAKCTNAEVVLATAKLSDLIIAEFQAVKDKGLDDKVSFRGLVAAAVELLELNVARCSEDRLAGEAVDQTLTEAQGFDEEGRPMDPVPTLDGENLHESTTWFELGGAAFYD